MAEARRTFVMSRRSPPDKSNVLEAVEGYFGEEPSGPSRAALLEWGESALPFLEEIANEPHDPRLDHAIVFSVTNMATVRACALFVELLGGRTSVRPDHALYALPVLLEHGEARRCLEFDPLFKETLLGFASSASVTDRAIVLQAAQSLGWMEDLPRLLPGRCEPFAAGMDPLQGLVAPPPDNA